MVAIFGEAVGYVEGTGNPCDPGNLTGMCADTFSRVVAETTVSAGGATAGWGDSEIYRTDCSFLQWVTGVLPLGADAHFSVDGSVGIMSGGGGAGTVSIDPPITDLPFSLSFDMTVTDIVILVLGFPAYSGAGVLFSLSVPSLTNALWVQINMSSLGDWDAFAGYATGGGSSTTIGSSAIGAVGSTATISAHVDISVSASEVTVSVGGADWTLAGWPEGYVGPFSFQGLGLTFSTPVTMDNVTMPCGGAGGAELVSTIDIPEPDIAGAYVPPA
jgi:hypothetical protein